MSNDCEDLTLSLGLADHDAYCSGSDIDSDLEAALYGQLHHEPNITEVPPAISDIPTTSAHYVNYLDPDAQPTIQEHGRSDFYHGNRSHDSFIPIYSEEFKYQPRKGSFSRKRFFNSPLLAYPNKIQCREIYSERPLFLSGRDNPVENSNQTGPNSSERTSSRTGRSRFFESKETAYEVITVSDSPLSREENRPRKRCAPPLIDLLLEASSEPGHSKKQPYISCEEIRLFKPDREVIEVSDSPVVVSSDTTIDVPSSSDEDIVIDTDMGQPSDILTNLQGCKHVEEEIQDILNNMSGNPELWCINEKDRFPESYRQTFHYKQQFKLLKVTCANCQERGHLSRNCTNSRKLIVCFLCGTGGHEASECPLPSCVRCMKLGHTKNQCLWKNKNLRRECPSCKMRGHLREECPDHWRKYHMTTSGRDVIVPVDSSSQASTNISCYNCGRVGHLGHECKKARMENYVYPTLPWVVNYENPSECLGMQKKKNQYLTPKGCKQLLKHLYRMKQKQTTKANERYAIILAKKRSRDQNRLGKLRGRKGKRKKSANLSEAVFRNGQIYYPRECGAMGNSGRNIQEKIQAAQGKKQKTLKRWQDNSKRFFKQKFQTLTLNATGSSFHKRKKK